MWAAPWERERFHEKRDQDVNEKSVEVCISADFFHMPVTSIIFPVRVFSAHPAWKVGHVLDGEDLFVIFRALDLSDV